MVVGRGIEDPVAGGVVVGAGGAAQAGADESAGAGGRGEGEDLVACLAGDGGLLEDQRGAVEGPVALGVFAFEGELFDGAEAGLAGLHQFGTGGAFPVLGMRCGGRDTGQTGQQEIGARR